ncbi:unnamed protein product [Adineta steineri]|uniref:Uncharacterized protein n=1 Tax=Adineta steineri TaxID=433720 RepID=A0A814TD07_9BILA|nr:unnamed protein product [Adineta steineri]CAF1356262.1 unnamed protein product [Adineta steineri]
MSSEITTMDSAAVIEITTLENSEQIDSDEIITISNLFDPEINSIHESIGSAINDASIIRIDPDKKLTKPIIACLIFALYTCIVMAIAIIIVCLTYPEQSYTCMPTFKLTVEGVVGYNSRSRSIALEDFNHDNKIDIASISYGTNSISMYFGYGNRTS